jgi:cytoskeletal protein CcmA (bactofilin family)
MWGKKPEQSDQTAPPSIPESKATAPSKPAQAPMEATKMSTDATRPLATPSSGATARLGASLHVKGEITGHEDLLVDGSVEGLIQLEDRKLTVGTTAKVAADVIAREVVVYGNVKGNLRARDRIEIKKDGSVVGDLTTARIMIEDGAYFKGSIEIDKTGDAPHTDLDKPAYARTPAATPGVKSSS